MPQSDYEKLPDRCVEAEVHEVEEVGAADACAEEEAVVVPLGHAAVAQCAVVTSLRSVDATQVTEQGLTTRLHCQVRWVRIAGKRKGNICLLT